MWCWAIAPNLPRMRRLACAVLVAAGLAGCGGGDRATNRRPRPRPSGRFDAERAFADLEAQVEIGPRESGTPAAHRTAELIAGRLADAGLDRRWRSSVRTRTWSARSRAPRTAPWSSARTTTPRTDRRLRRRQRRRLGGRGAARARPHAAPSACRDRRCSSSPSTPRRRAAIAPFEVDGTRGSRQYVDYAAAGGEQGSAPLGQIRAMVLFDLVGDCDLNIPLEPNSDPELYALFAEASARLDGDAAPFDGTSGPVVDDHVPFSRGGDPGGRPDRLRVRPRAVPGRLLAHHRGHARQGLCREPRRGRRGRAAGDPEDPLTKRRGR